jgi:sec-independent protein translocase protein TatA
MGQTLRSVNFREKFGMNVLEIGAPELLIVLLIVVLIFGPGRLVELGRELGRSIREFRKGIEDPKDHLPL